MRRFLHIGALVCSLAAITAHACLWDRDTLAAEARGLPGITEVITGRFDRFPPLFYEMRLERVASEIESEPDNLELYDDAGVACDRLGRSDEAIAWMERKLVVLERLESEGVDTSEHRYRYLANLGTFYIHRWLKGGQDREDMGDAARARDLIAAAIELNPDAHFGRERYQLLAIESLLNPQPMTSFLGEIHPSAHMLSRYPDQILLGLGHGDAVEGLTGLISLGAAWESDRIFQALELALSDEGNAVMALLVHLRIHEIRNNQYAIDSTGQKPLCSDDCKFPDIVARYDAASLNEGYFIQARQEAEIWGNARNRYLMERLEQGRHPDTDQKFWGAWKEVSSPPKMPGPSVWPVVLIALGVIVVFALSVLVFVVIIQKMISFARKLKAS